MNPKIIFVEDEVNVLKTLKRDIEMADIDAEYFTSAKDALGYLNQHQVGIVDSDLKMPEIDGITFLTKVQRAYPDRYRVILSCTGIENLERKEALANRTVEQCFDKPWDVNELVTSFERFKTYA